MSSAIKIPFNALPEQTRRRFAEATRNNSALHTVGASTIGPRIGWIILLLISGLAFTISLTDNFGSPWSFQLRGEMLVMLGVSTFFGAYAFLGLLRNILGSRFAPFVPGIYIFGNDIVKAKDPATLTILPLARIDRINVVHQHVNGVYSASHIHFQFQGGPKETVVVRGHAKVDDLLNRIGAAQHATREANASQNMEALAALDVFHDVRGTAIWTTPAEATRAAQYASGHNLSRGLPFPIRIASVGALVLTVLAVPVAFARDYLSDDAAFERIKAENTADRYQHYLRVGGNHQQEAQELLFMAAFQEAQATGTVTALRDYMREYPNSPHMAQVQAVMHQRFEQVEQTFLSQASTQNPAMPAFMSSLLDWLEANNSPPVQVRFSPPSAETLAQIDAQLVGVTPIAPHFTAERSQPRESQITEVFQRGFAAVFPTDVMSLTHTGRFDPAVPAVVPTFDIQYAVRSSGSTFTDEQNGRQYVGIHVDFHVSMNIPGSDISHAFDVAVQPPSHFSVSYQDTLGGPSDGVVYSTMARLAFERLSSNIAMTFFRPDSAAFSQAAAHLAGGAVPAGGGCTNTCNTANDNECDDGGPNSLYNVCALGTDCNDCGPRPPAAGGAPPPAPAANAGCTNTCNTANDGECDDGGPNSLYNVCGLGTDCNDCGPR